MSKKKYSNTSMQMQYWGFKYPYKIKTYFTHGGIILRPSITQYKFSRTFSRLYIFYGIQLGPELFTFYIPGLLLDFIYKPLWKTGNVYFIVTYGQKYPPYRRTVCRQTCLPRVPSSITSLILAFSAEFLRGFFAGGGVYAASGSAHISG